MKITRQHCCMMLGVVILIIVIIYLCKSSNNSTKKTNSSEQNKNMVNVSNLRGDGGDGKLKLYYTTSCGYCKKQLEMMKGSGLENKIDMINCMENKEACKSANVSGVPMWVKKNGEKKTGLQNLDNIKAWV